MAVGLKSLELLLEDNLAAPFLDGSEPRASSGLSPFSNATSTCLKRSGVWAYSSPWNSVQSSVQRPCQCSEELIDELSGLLGLLTLHKAGVHANLSLNAKRTIRLTPALNIPEPLLDELLDRSRTVCGPSRLGPGDADRDSPEDFVRLGSSCSRRLATL